MAEPSADASSRSPRAAAAAPRPNLLFVFADQLRWSSVGCYGQEHVHTPVFDRLAAQGAMLVNAVSTIPVCAPYRGCLLTGRYPLSNTVITNNIRLPADMPSLGKMLQAAGYDTGYIGKWHLNGEPAQEGFVPPGPARHGFEYWAAHNCSHDYRHGIYFRDGPEPIALPGWEPDVQTDLAIQFMRDRIGNHRLPIADFRLHSESQGLLKSEIGNPEIGNTSGGGRRPFALVMSWGPPHTPFIAPPEFEALYPDVKGIALRPNVQMVDDWISFGDYRDYDGPYRDPEMVLKHFTARYYAAISNLDYNFGRLVRALDELGVADDTVVVFTSDHGEMMGSHGHLHKMQPWDESARVPFLVRYPRAISAGVRSDVPLGTPDILPTLFGLMGLSVPPGVEGRDLSAALRGGAMPEVVSALLMGVTSCDTWGQRWTDCSVGGWGYPKGYLRPYRGVRTRTHTYVRDRQGPWYLYDNEHDPYQMSNLVEGRAPSAQGAAVPAELERELAQWLEKTGDYFGGNEDYQRWVDLNTGLVTRPEAFRRG